MATYYGNWTGGNRFRVVAYYTVLSKKSTYYKLELKVYLQTRYYGYDSNGVDAWSTGTMAHGHVHPTFNHSGSMQKTYMFTETVNVNRSYGSSTNASFNAYITDVAAYGGTSKASHTYSVPARSYSKPSAPTNFRTTSWNTSKYYLAWTRHPSTAGPYSSQRIEYDYLDSKGNRVGYRHLATVSSGSTSYSHALSADQRYYFRIRANGPGGSSGWRYFDSDPYVTTTPAAPTNTHASINSTGDTVIVNWIANNRYASSLIKHEIERQITSGGAWTLVKTDIGYNTTSWTDASPNGGYNKYRVRTYLDAYGPGSGYTYNSVWNESNTISTIVPPLVPTQLKPDGVIVDFNEDTEFTWQYNDGGDGANQSHFKLLIFDVNDTSTPVSSGNGASEISEFVLPGGVIPNGVTYLWQVKTQGATTVGYGPENSTTVTGRTTPTVTIDTTVTPDIIDQLPVFVEWAYQQDEGVPQASWQLRLQEAVWTGVGSKPTTYPTTFDPDNWDLGSIIVEHINSDTTTTDQFTAVLDDKAWYVLLARVVSGDGQTSNWDERYFLVDLAPPAKVVITPEYHPETGSVSMDIVVSDPETYEAPVESYDVQRRINDEDWITIVADIAADDYPSITVLDPIPTIYGTNEYRALVTSIAPSQNFSDVEIVTTGGIIEHDYIFVSFGVTFTELLRMRYNTDIGSSPSRKKDTIELLGRDFPLAVFGRSRSHKLDVQGNLFFLPDNTVDNGSFAWDSAPLEWEYAEFNADIVCYRDALGRRIFGQMTDTTPKIIRDGWGSVSFNIVRSDYVEGATIIPEVGDDI